MAYRPKSYPPHTDKPSARKATVPHSKSLEGERDRAVKSGRCPSVDAEAFAGPKPPSFVQGSKAPLRPAGETVGWVKSKKNVNLGMPRYPGDGNTGARSR